MGKATKLRNRRAELLVELTKQRENERILNIFLSNINQVTNLFSVEKFPEIDSSVFWFLRLRSIEGGRKGRTKFSQKEMKNYHRLMETDAAEESRKETEGDYGIDLNYLDGTRGKINLSIVEIEKNVKSAVFCYIYQRVKDLIRDTGNPILQFEKNALSVERETRKRIIGEIKKGKFDTAEEKIPMYYPPKRAEAAAKAFESVVEDVKKEGDKLSGLIRKSSDLLQQAEKDLEQIEIKKHSELIAGVKTKIDNILNLKVSPKDLLQETNKITKLDLQSISALQGWVDTAEKGPLYKIKEILCAIEDRHAKKIQGEISRERENTLKEKSIHESIERTIGIVDKYGLDETWKKEALAYHTGNSTECYESVRGIEATVVQLVKDILNIREEIADRFRSIRDKHERLTAQRIPLKDYLDAILKEAKERINYIEKEKLPREKLEKLLDMLKKLQENQRETGNIIKSTKKIYSIFFTDKREVYPEFKEFVVALSKNSFYQSFIETNVKQGHFEDVIELNNLLGRLFIQKASSYFERSETLAMIEQLKKREYDSVEKKIEKQLRNLRIVKDPDKERLDELTARLGIKTKDVLRIKIRDLQAIVVEMGNKYSEGLKNGKKLAEGNSVTILNDHRFGTTLKRFLDFGFKSPIESAKARTFGLSPQDEERWKVWIDLLEAYTKVYEGKW